MTGLLLAVLFLGTGEAGAQAQPQDQSHTQAQNDPDRVICKQVKLTGSRIASKVCGTAAQWQASEDQKREYFKQLDGRAATSGGSSSAVQ